MIQLTRIPIIKRSKGYYFRWWYNGWHYWQFFPGSLNYQTSGEKYRTYGMRSITVSSGQITLSQTNAIRTILNTKEVYLYTDSGWSVARIEPGTVPIKNNYINGYEITFTAWIGSRMISNTGFSPVIDIPIVPPADQCETIIGTQIWMCKNWDAAFPGSKVYGNIEANRAIYGGLYSYDQVMSAGFCPPGWHIPTVAEWQTLINYLGGSTVAGGKLKAAGLTYWDAPNTDADNSSGFDARAGGAYWITLSDPPMAFINKGLLGYYWAASPAGYNYVYALRYDNGEVLEVPLQTASDPTLKAYFSVRFIKDSPAPLTGTITDIDGNVYDWITIGSQKWLVQNLMTTKYNDGSPITNVTNNATWAALATEAYCWYGNDVANKTPYGALYNWFAVDTGKLAPTGWRVPTQTDWVTLIAALGGSLVGGKIKEIGLTHWQAPNNGAENYAGYLALPAGFRNYFTGAFSSLGGDANFWASTVYNSTQAYRSNVHNDTALLTNDYNGWKPYGFSVRCMRDL